MIGVLRRLRTAIFPGAHSVIFPVLLACVVVIQTGQPAQANPRYAAIVYDVKSGEVLFSRNADARRYPASITKVMTLYIVFEELEAGRLSLDTPMRVSQNAANQVPSKVGVRPGTTITVRDAIGVLVTRSANDVSVVVAEHIGGSVQAFAERMTRTARSIGMHNTTYRNPHGLPNSEQVTTARDIVKLGLAVQRRFPQYYHFFGMRSYTYAGTTYRNHNRLLGQMAGIDGLKTGFIRASGFNLLANLRRDGKHLIGVVMGGRTGATRNAHMREILSNALPQARSGPHLALASAPLPRPRPLATRSPLSPAARTAAAVLMPSTVVPATVVRAGPSRPAREAEDASVEAIAYAPQQEEAGSAEAAIDEIAPAERDGGWTIQIGAFNSEELAKRTLDRAQGQVPDALTGTSPFTETVNSNGTTLWRARFAGFQQHDAEAACAALERADFACFAVRN